MRLDANRGSDVDESPKNRPTLLVEQDAIKRLMKSIVKYAEHV